MLTVVVRGAMFPVSRKQALSAQKMQELQPQIKALTEKYKNNPQERQRAQMELFRKHNYNPLAGCLPMFIQLPIFVGLYRSLMVDVELRDAPLISQAVRWCSNLAAPDMLLQYSLHAPRRGREDVRAFMIGFRAAFPDLSFAGAADLIAEGDYVVGRWVGGGTHTGPAFSDFLAGSLPAASGRTMRFTGTTVLRIENGKIAEEIGLDDGVTALMQLGLIRRS